MREEVKQKIEASIATFKEGNKDLSDQLLSEAMQLTTTTDEKREAGGYLMKALGIRDKRQDVNVTDAISTIREAISLSYIAKTYFGKGAPWLMQRINGNMVNGKPAAFTTAELMTLANGLEDLGKRLLSASNGLHGSI